MYSVVLRPILRGINIPSSTIRIYSNASMKDFQATGEASERTSSFLKKQLVIFDFLDPDSQTEFESRIKSRTGSETLVSRSHDNSVLLVKSIAR